MLLNQNQEPSKNPFKLQPLPKGAKAEKSLLSLLVWSFFINPIVASEIGTGSHTDPKPTHAQHPSVERGVPSDERGLHFNFSRSSTGCGVVLSVRRYIYRLLEFIRCRYV